MGTAEAKKLTYSLLKKYQFLGSLSSRSMFGGFGILHDGIMFAWAVNNKLYLRANHDCLSVFTDLNMPPLSLSTGVISKLLHYYGVTDSIAADEKLFESLIKIAISGAISDKRDKLKLKESRLKDLPNMTLSLERLLMQIGIVNIQQLHHMGAAQTFCNLKQIKKSISINVLYTLSSAINGHHVAVLSSDAKLKLKDQVNKLTMDSH